MLLSKKNMSPYVILPTDSVANRDSENKQSTANKRNSSF